MSDMTWGPGAVAMPKAEYTVRCVPLERVTALEAEVERLRARVAQLEAALQASHE